MNPVSYPDISPLSNVQMVMRLNKICLGITEVSLSNSPSLPTHNMWWEVERGEGCPHNSNLVLGHGIQCLKTNQKRLLFPSSEDYSTTGGKGT